MKNITKRIARLRYAIDQKKRVLGFRKALNNVLLTVSGGMFTAGAFGMLSEVTIPTFFSAWFGMIGMLVYLICQLLIQDKEIEIANEQRQIDRYE